MNQYKGYFEHNAIIRKISGRNVRFNILIGNTETDMEICIAAKDTKILDDCIRHIGKKIKLVIGNGKIVKVITN